MLKIFTPQNDFLHYTSQQVPRGNDTQITIPSQITYGGQSVSVTEIHPNAFSGCTSVQTIVIPAMWR